MLDTNIISKNIVALRKQKGLTQQDLADKIHYSNKVISKWERGESVPDITALSALADFFGISLAEIANEIDFEPLGHKSDNEKLCNDNYQVINIEKSNNAKQESIQTINISETSNHKKIIVFATAIILALAILIPIFANAFKSKNYSLGDKIKTSYTYFQINSIAYPQEIGSFTADSGMMYVILEKKILNILII